MNRPGVLVTAVGAAGPAARAGLRPGDRILAVDGRAVIDALDVAHAIAQERSRLRVRRSGRMRVRVLDRAPGEAWGAELETPPVRTCPNRCVFCFVDQMPRGLRPGLYVKDEDYRHSFLYGNYVTLSNLTDANLRRIIRLHLSPLYISVHATRETVRRRLLGRRRLPPILPQLRALAAAGIRLHAQAVLCPGLNDGRVLEQTIRDLARLHPGVMSLAVVPVGLTRHRAGLAPLRRFTAREARSVLARVAFWQRHFLKILGSRFVFASDEWYLLAGRPLPADEAYEGYPQIENGVGLARRFLDAVREGMRHLPAQVRPKRRVWLAGGILAGPLVAQALRPLRRIRGLNLRVAAIVNRCFGAQVTVSGLVCGRDLIDQLRGRVRPGDRLLIPKVMLADSGRRFLDEVTPARVSRELGVRVRVVSDAHRLVKMILQG